MDKREPTEPVMLHNCIGIEPESAEQGLLAFQRLQSRDRVPGQRLRRLPDREQVQTG